jgi:hypothetical protein
MVFQASSGLGIPEILAHAQAIKNYSANSFALNPLDAVAAWPTFYDMDTQKFILRELEARRVFSKSGDVRKLLDYPLDLLITTLQLIIGRLKEPLGSSDSTLSQLYAIFVCWLLDFDIMDTTQVATTQAELRYNEVKRQKPGEIAACRASWHIWREMLAKWAGNTRNVLWYLGDGFDKFDVEGGPERNAYDLDTALFYGRCWIIELHDKTAPLRHMGIIAANESAAIDHGGMLQKPEPPEEVRRELKTFRTIVERIDSQSQAKLASTASSIVTTGTKKKHGGGGLIATNAARSRRP